MDDREAENPLVSDVPQGAGWWRASDGRYYPPEARPGGRASGPGGHDGDEPPGDQAAPAAPATPRDPDPTVDATSPTGFEPAPELDDAPDRTVESTRTTATAPEPEPRRRRWPVVVVVVLLVLAAAGGVAAWVVFVLGDDDDPPSPTTTEVETDTTEPDTTTTTEDTGEVSPFDLGVGDCFDTGEVDESTGLLVTTVVVTDCDEPHRAEVFALELIDAPAGAPFPGEDDRDRTSQELCEPGFVDYVGVSIAESELVLLWLAPTEESWTADDDREVACAIAAPDGEMLVGSVQGTGADDPEPAEDPTDEPEPDDPGEG